MNVKRLLGVAGALVMGASAAAGQGSGPGGAGAFAATRQDAREYALADSLRGAILALADFAGFADTPCSAGDVRTFERDTAGVARQMLAQLEALVLSHGAYASLETEAGRSLMRAVLRLEGGGPGPRWDTMTGVGPRAFNPLLPVELYDSERKACVATPGDEPDGIVLPDVSGLTVPRDSGAGNFVVAFGPGGVNTLRDHFFARSAGDSTAILRATRVTAHALWNDYAIVGVRRDQQLRGSVPVDRAGTGAVYVFRRTGDEWRLLAVARAW